MDLRTGYLQLQSSQGQVARNYFFVCQNKDGGLLQVQRG